MRQEQARILLEKEQHEYILIYENSKEDTIVLPHLKNIFNYNAECHTLQVLKKSFKKYKIFGKILLTILVISYIVTKINYV